ncbi:MAG: nucleotidyltransferase domain-containing protein [Desulfobacteraceae bacterium]|nr:nucleotidyltransferase domain-containing protein [Desulfobacteraceae bacterium]
MDISPEKMAEYRRTARKKQMKIRFETDQRRANALGVARKASELLKTTYRVKQVFLFGSLSRDGVFDDHSDIDLAVEGLDEQKYYKALARLSDLDMSSDIDLLMLEYAPPELLKIILNEGKKL